jgi:hypothetical protein
MIAKQDISVRSEAVYVVVISASVITIDDEATTSTVIPS